ncbi:MAG TPA: hypothetical protein VE133_07675, partial [Candidatus Sulfotelmatobacter sp.]|nr:hypothetical protein [Candidatus Sulfotelmatobacter sp.]
MKIFPRPRWRWVLPAVLAALLLGLGSAGLILWRAQHALRIATTEVQSEESLPFSVHKLVPVNTSFEWISAPDAFASAVFFKGDLYVCGASGLFRYDNHGILLKHYRPGEDLPSTPLLRVTTGV